MFDILRALAATIAASGLVLLVGPDEAAADVAAAASRTLSIYSPGIVPLDQSGNTSLMFTTGTDGKRVAITYNAVCVASGYVYVQIKVDGQPTSPSVNADFCSHSSSGSYDYVSASRQAYYVVPHKGRHAVTVTVSFSGNFFQIYDSSIIVQK